jgi:RNA polymerase sigma-70 factor (ECF subfamily)
MPRQSDVVNLALEEYRVYLETLTYIQIDPRLRSEFSMSDIIAKTLVEAWHGLSRIEALDADSRKRWLRKMLVHNLIEMIKHFQAQKRDFRLKQSLDAALEESSCRLQNLLIAEDTPPGEHLAEEETRLRVLEALSTLDARQREALILQKYHHWKLEQIAEHMGCTIGVVAGLHARGLKELRKLLPDME